MIPWFIWKGIIYKTRFDGSVLIIGCPICGDGIPCNGEPRDEMTVPHTISIRADGALTVSPSVICPRKCGWHVVITDGQAA